MTNKPFFIRQEEGILRRVDLDYIFVLEARDNYVKFYAVDEIATVRTSLTALMRILPKNQFVRVDRSFAVSLTHIVYIERDHVVVAKEGTAVRGTVRVSKKYYPALMKAIRVLDGNMNGVKEEK